MIGSLRHAVALARIFALARQKQGGHKVRQQRHSCDQRRENIPRRTACRLVEEICGSVAAAHSGIFSLSRENQGAHEVWQQRRSCDQCRERSLRRTASRLVEDVCVPVTLGVADLEP